MVELAVNFYLTPNQIERKFYDIKSDGLTTVEIQAAANKIINRNFKVGQVISSFWDYY